MVLRVVPFVFTPCQTWSSNFIAHLNFPALSKRNIRFDERTVPPSKARGSVHGHFEILRFGLHRLRSNHLPHSLRGLVSQFERDLWVLSPALSSFSWRYSFAQISPATSDPHLIIHPTNPPHRSWILDLSICCLTRLAGPPSWRDRVDVCPTKSVSRNGEPGRCNDYVDGRVAPQLSPSGRPAARQTHGREVQLCLFDEAGEPNDYAGFRKPIDHRGSSDEGWTELHEPGMGRQEVRCIACSYRPRLDSEEDAGKTLRRLKRGYHLPRIGTAMA